MEKVLEHFQSEAPEYDETIIRLIPFYRQMVDALIFDYSI